MSDIAYEIASYLDTAGYGTIGTDIFVGQIPAETNGVYVMRNGGAMNNYLPVTDSLVEIYVKNTKASTAASTIESIKNYIHRMHNTTTSGSYVYSMLLVGDVEDVLRDDEYGKIYRISVSVKHRDLSLIS